jgi:cupin fold WbuC family metalloprotein
MKIIDRDRLDQLSQAAAESERRRKNLNLHDEFDDPCQRLFNAIEPGTYIRPHRHLKPPKAESFVTIRGRMALFVFDDDGAVDTVLNIGEGSAVQAVVLPAGIWHSLVSLETGTIFFESSQGPYVPLSDKDFAPWAPAEGSPAVDTYLAGLLNIAGSNCKP